MSRDRETKEAYETGYNQAKALYEKDLSIAVSALRTVSDILQAFEDVKDAVPISELPKLDWRKLKKFVDDALSQLFIRR